MLPPYEGEGARINCRNLDWTNQTTSDLVVISLVVIFTRLSVLRSSHAPSALRQASAGRRCAAMSFNAPMANSMAGLHATRTAPTDQSAPNHRIVSYTLPGMTIRLP